MSAQPKKFSAIRFYTELMKALMGMTVGLAGLAACAIAFAILFGGFSPEWTPEAKAYICIMTSLGMLKIRDWLSAFLDWLVVRNERAAALATGETK